MGPTARTGLMGPMARLEHQVRLDRPGPQGEPGSGGAELPTAVVGQVLVSQGVGVAPDFTATPNAVSWRTVGGGFYETGRLGFGDVEVLRRDGSNGTLMLALSDRMVVFLEQTLAGLYSPSYVGTLANISDSTTDTPGDVVTGGGGKHVLARFNGTVWKVIG